MLKCFEVMNERWFHRAFVYTGSVTEREKDLDFRYRCEQTKGEDDAPMIKASTYSMLCYEKAQDVEEQTFPWTEEGTAALREWFQAQYERYAARAET